MKTTLSWLKTHLDTQASLGEIVERLTRIGLEVEGSTTAASARWLHRRARRLGEPHPNADRLRVCIVDTARASQVVCGAPNARTGMKGVFGPAGITVHGNGQKLEESTIRGVASRGMLMSAYELALSDDHEGIIELPADAPVGARYVDYAGLDDPVIEINLTPNRADCLGVRGIARDLAAAGIGTMNRSQAPVPGTFKSPIGIELTDLKACPLFLGRHIRGLKNGPAPNGCRRRLESIGLRPINALVDITNFITFDRGRPLHVFDAAKVKGNLLTARRPPGSCWR